MTTPLAYQLDRRRAPKVRSYNTFAGDLRRELLDAYELATRVQWPSSKYREDPRAFFEDILGVEPWEKQVEILEAVRDHPRVAVSSGHKVSKALALDTDLPTPSGWTTIGAVRVGDAVFDERGAPCRVIDATPVMLGHDCYEVEFDDGTTIVADAGHQWATWTHQARKAEARGCSTATSRIHTTEGILATLQTKHSGRNHAIRNAAPIRRPSADLPVDPYLLGVWLGDGSTGVPHVTTADEEIEQAFQRAGWHTRRFGERGRAWAFSVDPAGEKFVHSRGACRRSRFLAALADAGVLHRKHVPTDYLRASEPQRRDLLAGLLDTDGSCRPDGRITFSNTNRSLAAGVHELAASLGYKPHWSERRAKLNGKDCGPVFAASFTAHDPVFRLPRKLARQHSGKSKRQWIRQRMIVAVRPVPSVPVRCISVDSPSRLFLASRAFIPTHNSHTAAGIAQWFYCSFDDARVVMTSTTSRQVDQILWRELRMMRARGGLCLACKRENEDRPLVDHIRAPCEHSAMIDGQSGELARTGLKSHDFREVVGFTAREAEAVAGISGRNLLYILDEASGIDQAIFEAIEGNRAGGARLVMFSNPTKNEGEFYDAFNSKSKFYKTLTISSEETPNVREGRVVIPGLATREWIDEKREEWGENSPLYQVRVRGKFATKEEGKIFSIHAIGQAEAAWLEVAEAGRLYIGLDPAGESGMGDETLYAPRRGLKILSLHKFHGLNDEQHLVNLLALIDRYRIPRETPVVVVDREGSVGASVYGALRGYTEAHPDSFELVGVRASDRAQRQPRIYDRMRDELTANFEAWIRDGGAIPEDAKLAKEMHAPEWIQAANGRLKVTPKDKLRKMLGRSPDRYDACCLSCWEPLALREEEDAADGRAIVDPRARRGNPNADDPLADLDPYDATDGMDPYGGRGRRR